MFKDTCFVKSWYDFGALCVVYYSFSNNSMGDASAKQAAQGLSSYAYKPRASETRKIPRSNNMKTFRKKFPIIRGFLRNNSVSKRFRYLGSGNVKLSYIYYCLVFADFRLKNLAKRIKFLHWRVTCLKTLYYEKKDDNRLCTRNFCSSLWFLKYNSRFCNENINFKYALETNAKCKLT